MEVPFGRLELIIDDGGKIYRRKYYVIVDAKKFENFIENMFIREGYMLLLVRKISEGYIDFIAYDNDGYVVLRVKDLYIPGFPIEFYSVTQCRIGDGYTETDCTKTLFDIIEKFYSKKLNENTKNLMNIIRSCNLDKVVQHRKEKYNLGYIS